MIKYARTGITVLKRAATCRLWKEAFVGFRFRSSLPPVLCLAPYYSWPGRFSETFFERQHNNLFLLGFVCSVSFFVFILFYWDPYLRHHLKKKKRLIALSITCMETVSHQTQYNNCWKEWALSKHWWLWLSCKQFHCPNLPKQSAEFWLSIILLCIFFVYA